MAKIGLLAPFEGLHRRSGYEALAALRMALADYAAQPGAPEVAVLPVALDDSRDPARAAQKLLEDQGVQVIVGPLTPATAAAVEPVIGGSPTARPWLTPFAVALAGGFAPPAADSTWATALVATVAAAARQQGAQTLVLAGQDDGWPALTDADWAAAAGMPVRRIGPALPLDDQTLADGAVFWMGDAESGARFLVALHERQPTVPFWLGPQGGDPVFAERAAGALGNTYWAIWSSVGYDAWAAQHSPSTPNAFLMYLATQQALAAISGETPQPEQPWQIELFSLQPDGTSRRLTAAP